MQQKRLATVEQIKLKRYRNGRIVLSSKINSEYDYDIDRSRKKVIMVRNALMSAKRSKQTIEDICENNQFMWFVTLTFGTQERLNDTYVKAEWDRWRHQFRKMFPHAYYIAVPEYHKRGGLHIHMCLGGVDEDDLELTDSGNVCCHWVKNGSCKRSYFEATKDMNDLKETDGEIVYNVGAWKLGFSTATKIHSQAATKAYICKYISKGGMDTRFYNAKRYWASRNVERLEEVKEQYLCSDRIGDDIMESYEFKTEYVNYDIGYRRSEFIERDNTSQLKSILEQYKGRAFCTILKTQLLRN